MPRRPAAERHLDSQPPRPHPAEPAPPEPGGPPPPAPGDESSGHILPTVDALVAISHPLRRRMLEALRLDGPASVGQLAQRLGVAVGSISHHMKSLHANGFVTPAPELARDTRESWWRPVSVRLSWSRYDFAEGTTAREVAELAARSIVERQMELIRSSLDHRVGFGSEWDRAGMISDTMAKATHEQVVALSTQLSSVVDAWRRDCTADAAEHPDADRAAIFVATYALPVRL